MLASGFFLYTSLISTAPGQKPGLMFSIRRKKDFLVDCVVLCDVTGVSVGISDGHRLSEMRDDSSKNASRLLLA